MREVRFYAVHYVTRGRWDEVLYVRHNTQPVSCEPTGVRYHTEREARTAMEAKNVAVAQELGR